MAMQLHIHIVSIIALVLVLIQNIFYLLVFNEVSFECSDLLMLEPVAFLFSPYLSWSFLASNIIPTWLFALKSFFFIPSSHFSKTSTMHFMFGNFLQALFASGSITWVSDTRLQQYPRGFLLDRDLKFRPWDLAIFAGFPLNASSWYIIQSLALRAQLAL